MINNLESYNKKRLIELIELQIEEYRKLVAEGELLKQKIENMNYSHMDIRNIGP